MKGSCAFPCASAELSRASGKAGARFLISLFRLGAFWAVVVLGGGGGGGHRHRWWEHNIKRRQHISHHTTITTTSTITITITIITTTTTINTAAMTVSLPLAGILPSSPVQLLLLIIALPFLSVLAFFLYFLSFAFARLVSVHILRSDDYANLPRPRHGTWTFPVFGDFPAIRKAPPAEAHLEWMQELGTPVYAYRGIFYSPRLLLADPKALGYLLGSAHSYEYPKPSGTRLFLKSLLGEGLLVAEGE